MTLLHGGRRILADVEFLKFFLFDVLGSIILGLAIWIVTGESVSSLLISLITATMLLTVELRFQIIRAKDDLSVAVGFQRESLRDHYLLNGVSQVVEAYSKVLSSGNTFFLERARELIGRFSVDMTKLREGHMEVKPDEIYHHLIARLKGTKDNLFATSFVSTADFWFRGGGKEWLEGNFSAQRRGVSITRVFFMEDTTDLTEQVRDLIKVQVARKIDVKIAYTQNLTPDLLHDVIIFDDRDCMYLELIPGSKEMRGGHFYRDEGEIRKARSIRDRILQEARNATDITGNNPQG